MRHTHGYPGVIPILIALALPSCGSPTRADPSVNLLSGNGVIFLALAEAPNAHMDALFQGVVRLDAAGCLRLQNSEGSTVIWPHGASLAGSGSELRVVDAKGRVLGRIGGTFTFGGGHVPTLHDGIKLTQAQRDQALASCPGDFWIVAGSD